ncbi:hypothetical protein EDC05_006397 [Coemansia umbellata]|uniref:Uncharacterized protein n=1 Tax=Coemansia umbellata TaxID=1424467 RepID=A0ABQ8PCW5_9FUNG|nr:hypothetical protein EDC05_006397 [Coemansia umbellata]
MRFFTVLAFSVAASAQEIGFSAGANVASGSSAIDNPNINNGVQVDSSLFASGVTSGNTLFNHISGSHFASVNENLSIQDNLANNPGFASVAGSSGWTANGDANSMGPVKNDFRGAADLLHKRGGDIVFASNNHYSGAAVVYHPAVVPYLAHAIVHIPVSVVTPGYSSAPIAEQPKPEYKAPVAEQPKPEYKAPVVEQPKPEYKAPVVEQPKPEYKAPIVEQPKPAAYSAPTSPAPAKYEKAEQEAIIVQNKA